MAHSRAGRCNQQAVQQQEGVCSDVEVEREELPQGRGRGELKKQRAKRRTQN
jgi:hypothetical protein